MLSGAIPPPPEADALYRALNAKFHSLGAQTYTSRSMGSEGEDGSPRSIGRNSSTFKSAHISAPGTLRQPPPIRQSGGYGAPMAIQQQPYNPTPSPQPPPSYQPSASSGNNYNNSYGQDIKPPVNNYNNSYNTNNNNNSLASQAAAKRAPPPPPPSRKPVMPPPPSEPVAKALYAFDGQQQGDLSFHEGDVITIVQKTDSQDDWWTGKINGRQGIVSLYKGKGFC